MLKYHKGDLFKLMKLGGKYIYLPHIVNNKGIFGGGFTAHLEKHYPKVGQEYRSGHKKYILGENQYVHINTISIVNMFAQNSVIGPDNPKPIKYAALCKCMEDIADRAKTFNGDIWTIKFGSDLAGGNWDFIEELIEEIWCKVEVNVAVL